MNLLDKLIVIVGIIPWSKDGRKYLVKLAYRLGFNELLLLQLGCQKNDIVAVTSQIRSAHAAMFEVSKTTSIRVLWRRILQFVEIIRHTYVHQSSMLLNFAIQFDICHEFRLYSSLSTLT